MDKTKLVFGNRLTTAALLWTKLPLAAFAGLRVRRLDETGAEVSLPAGWKTQNPFGSTYFAAQAMAAEMSTGAPALWFIEKSGKKVSSLVTALSAKFTKKATTEARFVFRDGHAMREAIEQAVRTEDAVTFTARSVGTQRDGTTVAEFEVQWSFKSRLRG
jgi:acyl-coenzyme A thioesterase PaaI-like protein